jgi:protease PrsW
MSLSFFLEAPIALIPALLFLIVLDRLDSFRLVSLAAAVAALAAGGLLAIVSYFINDVAMDTLRVDITSYTRYGAPIVEETLKAAVVVYLFTRARIGFMVDAAIMGFAIGTGFALVENLYFLYSFPDANPGVWIVRGFGTAMMHGGATAIFGVLAQMLSERHKRFAPLLYLPGLIAAIVVHSLFNHLLQLPMVATVAMIVLVPAVLFFVFAKSESRIHKWITSDHETHQQLLASMDGEFAKSEGGRFIADVADKFAHGHAAEIFAYMRLHTELVLRAEEMLLAREKGQKGAISDEDVARFERLHALERSIGRTALLALWPHLHYSRQELAELYELEARAKLHRHRS